ncbi:MAG: tRNA 2-thiouridine(34) synthase MnmA [Candidatus Babeliales bacterium]
MNIAVLVSGGVDSSVALRLLKDSGHNVTAFYLKIWLEDELSYLGHCPWQEDLAFVRAVCEQAGVPLEVVSLQDAYWSRVVSYTIAEIKAGRTPNPDIMCNKRVKFGAFFEAIANHPIKFDKIATGHYARVEEKDGRVTLHAAPDDIKDQTYFLSGLSQEQLKLLTFPLGNLNKSQVRELAQKYELPNKDRKDSQGICFLGKIKFADFVRHHMGDVPGDLVEYETGKVWGKHNGFWYYTIGQRQGIGLSHGPWYVVAKDTQKNIVYISAKYYSEEKERNNFEIVDINWLSGKPNSFDNLEIKLRHGANRHACVISVHNDNAALITLKERDQGIAAGQFAVLYNGDQCLGGGIIT